MSSGLSFKATLGAVKFFDMESEIPEPQWRILINGESKAGRNGQKTIALVQQYRKRVAAVDAFWGLSAEDRSDLDRLIDLAEDPKIALPTTPDGTRVTCESSVWGVPFLAESDSPRDKSDEDSTSSYDSSSESDEEADEQGDAVVAIDAPELSPLSYVVIRPAPGEAGEEKFWIGQIVPSRSSDRRADSEIQVHWLGPAARRGATEADYELLYRDEPRTTRQGSGATKRVNAVDWIPKSSIQANVQLTKRGALVKKSWRYIHTYLLPLWAREDNESQSSNSSSSSSSSGKRRRNE